MNKIKTFGIICFILMSSLVFSQKRELGQVTIDELKEKTYPRDTSAAAVVLFEKGKTSFEFNQNDGFSIVTDVDVKIKIYKKAGYDYATKEIAFYVGGTKGERVEFSKAITYNLVNGAIEKTKLKSEGEFVEKKNKFWTIRKITMPNVKEGSIIEYKYIIRSPYTSTFPKWSFQREIPVVYSEYMTSIPEYYFYNVYRKGYLTPTEIKSKQNRTITLEEKSLNQQGYVVRGYTHNQSQISYYDNTVVYKLENIPALKEESFVNNIENYTASVEHELSGVQMPQSSYESFATDWETITKKIYEDEDFGPQLKKEGYFDNDVKTLLEGLTTRDEKIAVIFDFVKSRMTWDGFNSYSCDKGVSRAYQDKTGNSAEINLMLTAMLRYAGLSANPVLLSTRANGIALYPTRSAFNYVIAAVEIEDDLILLDATNKNAVPNVLPIRDLNWFGRIIRKEGSSAQVDLTSKMISKEIINMMYTVAADGSVNGKIRDQYTDYNAYNFRENYASIAEDTYLEKLEKKMNGTLVSDYVIENKKEYYKPVIETYSFKNSNAADVVADKIYINPLLFFSLKENYFKEETRQYPIDFVYANEDKFMVMITIPEGYAVETIPAPVNIVFSDNLLSYKFNISNAGKTINVTSILDINSSVISEEDYISLKAFFNEIVKKQTEKIVLKKI